MVAILPSPKVFFVMVRNSILAAMLLANLQLHSSADGGLRETFVTFFNQHLRATDYKYEEYDDRSKISDFTLFHLKDPFGEPF